MGVPCQGLLRQPQCPAEDIITTLPVQVCRNKDSANAHKVGMTNARGATSMLAHRQHRPRAPDRVAAIVRGLGAAFVACSSSGRCSGPGRGLWPAAQGGQTSSLHDLGQFAGCGTNEVASIQQQQQQTVSPAQGLLRQPQCPAEDIITTLPGTNSSLS